MAAPTFTSVTPSSGLSGGGSLVVIEGTNFDIPAALGDPVPEVTVQFGALFARDVRVTSATRLTCLPPRGEIPDGAKTLDVDITITNVDQSMPNSVVATDAYTYRRPLLDKTNPSHLLTTIATLMQRMREQILVNTVLTTHVDYDESATDLMNRVALATLPGIILRGPRLELLPVINNGDAPVVTLPAGDPEPTDFEVRDHYRQVNVTLDVTLMAAHTKVLINLMQAAVDFMQRNEYLRDVPRDPFDSGAGVVRYPLQIVGDFAAADTPSRANVREAVGSWLIEGVLLENGDLVESAPTVDTSVVTVQQLP